MVLLCFIKRLQIAVQKSQDLGISPRDSDVSSKTYTWKNKHNKPMNNIKFFLMFQKFKNSCYKVFCLKYKTIDGNHL